MDIQVNEPMEMEPLHGVDDLAQDLHDKLLRVLVPNRNEVSDWHGIAVNERKGVCPVLFEAEALDELEETVLIAQAAQNLDLILVLARVVLDKTFGLVGVVSRRKELHVTKLIHLIAQLIQVTCRILLGLYFERVLPEIQNSN